MAVVSMSNLLEAGVHFGHQTKRWNPKMKPYIFTSRDDIYIIDLEKTVDCLEKAYAEIKKISENGGKFIFVGTKKQANDVSKEEALRSDSYYVTERWLGGTLTNLKTIKRSFKKLERIEKMEKEGRFELLPKKEVILIKKEYDKLNKVLCGIRNMEKQPDAMIVVDPKKEINAIREARKIGIPVFGLVDTNCDPDDVDFVIPGNDDAVRSVAVILGVLNNAICEGKNLPLVDYISETSTKNSKKEAKEEKKEVKKEEKVEIKEEKKETKKEIKEEKTEEVKEVKTKKEPKKEEDTNLESLTLKDLKAMAKEKGLTGYSTMKKDDLISALKNIK